MLIVSYIQGIFSKGEEILFIELTQICVIVTEINVLNLFYICHFFKLLKNQNSKK